ncbi:MAG TPA: hypothetical protein VMZ51_02800 [Acidimicrobiales bacterium]|nr:hypothetical protein [Acidimicrobiales bacterium]
MKRLHTRRLVTITGVLTGLTVIHDLDHLRQGRGLPPVLYLVAVAALLSLALTLNTLLSHSSFARPVAVGQGMLTVVGVAAVHALPQWTHLADSYSAAHADAFSWAIIVAMMVLGLVLAVVGFTSKT